MNFITNPHELPRNDSVRRTTGEILGSLTNLSESTGLRNLFIQHEILKPGHRSSPAHQHSHKEEFVYVLRGTVAVWIDGNWHTVEAGSAISFPPLVPHMVTNGSLEDAELLVVSTALNENDTITFVPDEAVVQSQPRTESDYRFVSAETVANNRAIQINL